jgi:hypothetical protein
MYFESLLKEFSADRFPYAAESFHPEKASVISAREMVAIAIKNDDFICDCISLEIDRLGLNKFSSGLMPFYTVPGLGISFALGYWSPGSSVGPHEHTAWTITAVCSNKLEVIIYDRDESYKTNSLVPKRRFNGFSGMTGSIYEPCIHDPRNTTNDWSLTFHATSPLDGLRPADHPEPLSCLTSDYTISPGLAAHPYLNVITACQKIQFVNQLVKKLLTINTPKARSVLIKCLDVCSISTRNELKVYLCKNLIENISPKLLLQVTDPKLELQCHCENNKIVLSVMTPKSLLQVLALSTIAKEAIIYAVQERVFDPEQLPGDLTKQERYALAEALEETGLFKRINN